MSKKILRKKLIYIRRNNFVDQTISFVRFNKILKKYNLKKNIYIGGYYPVNSEISCLDVLEILEKKNFKISLPITKKNNNMDFYEWSFQDALRVGRQGIPEPNTKKKVIPIKSNKGDNQNIWNNFFFSIWLRNTLLTYSKRVLKRPFIKIHIIIFLCNR